MLLAITLILSVLIASACGFVAYPKNFHRRIFAEKEDAPKMLPKIKFGELLQLITFGLGAPSLGEYKGTDENGKMMFELDANKFNGGYPGGQYVESGYVEETDDGIKPPGFWQNLISGGKMQGEYEEKLKSRK